MTHSDVPGAFSVWFVIGGESFTGHDAGVCDQVATAGEDWPEKERVFHRNKMQFFPFSFNEEYLGKTACTSTHKH